MPTVNKGPCDDCGCSSSGCACSDAETLYLDFEGEVITLTQTIPGTWVGTGSPGGCSSVWEFTVNCLSDPDPIWTLTIDNPDSATCVIVGPFQGSIISCNPLEVTFPITVSQPPMMSCCLGGTFPRSFDALLTL